MIQTKHLLLLILLAFVTVTTAAVVLHQRREQQRVRELRAQQHASDTQTALRKTAEFLMPDTKSDIRFGKPRSSAPASTPTPATP